MKMQVLQNLTKLKGLNIKIAEDLTREELRTTEKNGVKMRTRRMKKKGKKPSNGVLGEALAVGSISKKFMLQL